MSFHGKRKTREGQSKRVVLPMRYGRLGVADGGRPVFFVQAATEEERMVRVRSAGVRKCIVRVERERAFQQDQRLLLLRRHSRIDVRQSP